MTTTLCIVANPQLGCLEDGMVSSIARMLETTPHWLAPREACEFVGEFEKEILSSLLRDLRGDGEYDVIVLPDHNRQKKMLIADMDSTIITIECIDELADFMGIKSEVAAITNRAMAGELNFIDALRERVALLAGLKVSVIHEVCRERVELTPGARCLVQTMRASGAVTALVSGGFAQFTEYVADLAGFQYHVANRLETKGGVLTGHVDEPIRDSSAKLQTLLQISMNYGLKPQDILAVGDGANDLEMIKEAGIGCAYRAHAILRTNADIEINNTALTTALFAQGIERSSFAVN